MLRADEAARQSEHTLRRQQGPQPEAGSTREPSVFAARAKSLWLGSIGAPYRTSWAIVAISVARETWDRADVPPSPSAAGEAARRSARATNKAVAAVLEELARCQKEW